MINAENEPVAAGESIDIASGSESEAAEIRRPILWPNVVFFSVWTIVTRTLSALEI